MKFRYSAAIAALALTSAPGLASEGPQHLSPEQTAAALFAGKYVESNAPAYVGSLSTTALGYLTHMRQVAAQLGGTRQYIPPSVVSCEFGGEIEISGELQATYYVLKAEFRQCASHDAFVETRRNGSVAVRLIDSTAGEQRPSQITVGLVGRDFIEERYHVLDLNTLISRTTANLKVAGEFPRPYEPGDLVYADYDLISNGSLREKRFYIDFDGQPFATTFAVSTKNVHSSGEIRVNSDDVEGVMRTTTVTETQLHSGALTIDSSNSKATPSSFRREWSFREFKTEVTANDFTPEVLHEINGVIRVSTTEDEGTTCPNGLLRFETARRLVESQPGAQEHSSGMIAINGSTMRFSFEPALGIYPVVIKSPGFDAVTTDYIWEYNTCNLY